MKSQDLFPETLLVSREGEHIYTTSRRVAFHFGKQHKNVIQSIDKMIFELNDEGFNGLNFQPITTQKEAGDRLKIEPISTFADTHFWLSEYIDERNRKKPEYLMSEEGFALLAMGFTGQEALRWKVAFLHEFRYLEAELADHHARRIAALDTLHPHLLPTVEDYERGLPRGITAQRLGRSLAAVTYHRRKARRLGLLAAPAARGQA